MFERLVDLGETAMSWLHSFVLHGDAPSFIDLEAPFDEVTLAMKNGTLVTFLECNGTKEMVGDQEMAEISARMNRTLRSFMGSPGHFIDYYFSVGDLPIQDVLVDALYPSYQTMKRIGLEGGDILQDRIETLSKYCSDERGYLVVQTSFFALYPEQVKKEIRFRGDLLSKHGVKATQYGQNMTTQLKGLGIKHRAFMQAISEEFAAIGLQIRVVPAREAGQIVKSLYEPGSVNGAWKPRFVGDAGAMRAKGGGVGGVDDSHALPPKLSYQLAGKPFVDTGDGVGQVAGRYVKGGYFDLWQMESEDFRSLFRKLGKEIPFRFHVRLSGGGEGQRKGSRLLASVIGFIGDYNKGIKRSYDELNAISKAGDPTTVAQVYFSTWAKTKEDCERNYAILNKAMQAWGNPNIADEVGEPVRGHFSSIPGASLAMSGSKMLVPLSELVNIAPYVRPASPWKRGAMMLRTPDGKLFPYQPGSSLQTAWVNLFYAPMGSGKSVGMNAHNYSTILMDGLERLPYMLIIDVGPSSSGLISLLQSQLPAARREEAGYFKLRMDADHAINPFDTQLGCRYPMPMDRAFLVSLLSIIGTPVGKSEPYPGVSELAGLMVDEIYRIKDKVAPKLYEPKVEPTVDGALAAIGHIPDQNTTWWEVVDVLFEAGGNREAVYAQRNAVPLLSDLMSVIFSQEVKSIYDRDDQNAMRVAETGEKLLDAMARMISSALREYPVLAFPTRFSIGNARVVSIDLNDVTRGNGDAAQKEAALMLALARNIGSRNFYLDPTITQTCPSTYHDHHLARVKELKEEMKVISIDEFHRSSKVKAMRNMVMLDIREGRKWNIMVNLASQLLDDFDEEMVELASTVFILNSGTDKTMDQAEKVFGLTATARQALATHVHGPGPGGANFIAWMKTKHGRVMQLLTMTIGPIELWAYSTTAEDAALRNRLYELMGDAARARRVLAARYPGGTAKSDIEKLKASMVADEGGVIERLAHDLSSGRTAVTA